MSNEPMQQITLDQVVRATASQILNGDQDIVVTWITLVGVRRADGTTGGVLTIPSPGMPNFEVRGILHEALAAIDRPTVQQVQSPDG